MPKDINTATQAELEQVPLISRARAATIIDWRDSHGPIDDMAKLTEIPGIGDRMVQRMAEHFSAGSGAPSADQGDQDEENGGVEAEGDPDEEAA